MSVPLATTWSGLSRPLGSGCATFVRGCCRHHHSSSRLEPGPPEASFEGLRGSLDNEVVARLQGRGAELVGEIAQYEDVYRLCFVRGFEGIIIGLAEELAGAS